MTVPAIEAVPGWVMVNHRDFRADLIVAFAVDTVGPDAYTVNVVLASLSAGGITVPVAVAVPSDDALETCSRLRAAVTAALTAPPPPASQEETPP